MPREGESAERIVAAPDVKPWEVWSSGGGVQSSAIAALIVAGRLPKPDFAVMVDTERERSSTWRYVKGVVSPALEAVGVTLHIVRKSIYATVDLWGGADGDTVLIPAFSDRDGSESKLPEFCSGEWKREPVMRWCRAMGLHNSRAGVRCWLGISTDEQRRRRGARRQWFQPHYPLLDVVPLSRADCYKVVADVGWPDPPRSCCWMCPNMHDREWLDIKENDPDDFAAACRLQAEVQAVDPNAWLHRSRKPLELVEFKADSPGLFSGGCTSGLCH